MLDLRIVAAGRALSPAELPAILGRRAATREIGNQIEALIALVDDLGGDPDLEQDDSDLEPAGDETDIAYPEWHTLRVRQRRADQAPLTFPHVILAGSLPSEDDEMDDPPEEDDFGEDDDPAGQADEDCCNTGTTDRYAGPGCALTDPEEDDGGTYYRLRERRRRQRREAAP